MSEKIRETGELFDAVQTVGNRAVSRLGYNRPYTFSENLTVSYGIYISGPAIPYRSQYAYLNEEELGERVDREPGITDEAWCRKKGGYFHRIVIRKNEKPVFILQGKDGFRCSFYSEGAWEEELMKWFRTNGGQEISQNRGC